MSMRCLATAVVMLVLLACSTDPAAPNLGETESGAISQAQTAAVDDAVRALIASAAADFHAHPPRPAGFRDVRIGHVITSSGEPQYLLCGEFLPSNGTGKAEWVPFATIKTAPYEQWLGAQAVGLCGQSSIVWEKRGDLSSKLQRRFESLQ